MDKNYCEYYHEGMCIYIPKNKGSSAVYEKCQGENIKEYSVENCLQRKTIDKLQEKDKKLEAKVQ